MNEAPPIVDREHESPEQEAARLNALHERQRLNAARWLDGQGQRDVSVGMSVAEFQALRGLLGNPAFGIFWSLIRHARSQHERVLLNSTLGEPAKDAAASVIQGHIRAFDQIREMLLDIADPRIVEETVAAGGDS